MSSANSYSSTWTEAIITTLLVLLGFCFVAMSFFLLPLYAIPDFWGGGTPSAWESAQGLLQAMRTQGVSFEMFSASVLIFLPLCTSAILCVVGIVRFLAEKVICRKSFLIIALIGCIPIALFSPIAIGELNPQIGYIGIIGGFCLLFIAHHRYERNSALG